MDAKKLTGPKAGSLKYDLLTTLAVAGLHGSPGFQTSMLRLTALVTARYNWRLDEVSVGQRDMARMWCVNERTVKREIKRLTAASILICKRQGVRGRVGAYRLNYAEIYRQSQAVWAMVGPDFEERMAEFVPEVGTSVVKVDFGGGAAVEVEEPVGKTPGWRHVLRRLKERSPNLYANWYSNLQLERADEGVMYLQAPTKFVARYVETHLMTELVGAIEAELGPVERIVFSYGANSR